MITKHKDHTCKECQHKLTSFMDLLKHVAEQHDQEAAEEKGEQDEQKVEEKNNFAFSESMLDKLQS